MPIDSVSSANFFASKKYESQRETVNSKVNEISNIKKSISSSSEVNLSKSARNKAKADYNRKIDSLVKDIENDSKHNVKNYEKEIKQSQAKYEKSKVKSKQEYEQKQRRIEAEFEQKSKKLKAEYERTSIKA